MSDEAEPNLIHTLICHRDIEHGLLCLRSVASHCKDTFSYIIHDDGSLTDRDVDQLKGMLPVARIVGRDEADDYVYKKLADYPAALEYRRTHILSLKLFDFPLFSQSKQSTFIDSDILFLREFSGLFNWSEIGEYRFTKDHQNAYSFRPWAQLGRRKIAQRINSGLVQLKLSAYSLETIEEFLSNPNVQKIPQWVEQTAWAWLSADKAVSQIPDRQISVYRDTLPGDPPHPVAYHFVSGRRSLIGEFAKLTSEPHAEALVSDHPGYLKPMDLLFDRMRHRFFNR